METETALAQFAGALRALADWYEAHPEMPLPLYNVPFSVYSPDSREDASRVARALAPCEKSFEAGLFMLARDFGGVTLRFVFSRKEVCKARVVGKRLVPAVPAQPEYEVDILEWDCEEPLLALEAERDNPRD